MAMTPAEKLAWAGVGPWTDEPDHEEWTVHGLRCEVDRQRELCHLCGYVTIPPGHVLFGRGLYGYPDAPAHRGITCAQADAYGWRIGLDCMHSRWDAIPFIVNRVPSLGRGRVYRDFAYVRRVTCELALYVHNTKGD